MTINISGTQKEVVFGRLFYVENSLLPLHAGILNWFTTSFYNKFKWARVAHYEKFISEVFQTQKDVSEGYDEISPVSRKPAIAINPVAEIEVDERAAQIWRFQEGAADFANLLHGDFTDYAGEYFRLTVIPVRIKGTTDIYMVSDSYSKLSDWHFQLLMFFNGGFNRPIRPSFIESDIVMPEELMTNTFYNNQYLAVSGMPINFNENPIEHKVIRNLARDYYYIPFQLDPQIRLESLTNASELYGGSDLAKWVLTANISYEVHVPSFFYLESDWKLDDLNMNFYATSDSVNYTDADLAFTEDYSVLDLGVSEKYAAQYKILGNKDKFKTLEHSYTFKDVVPVDTESSYTITVLADESITAYSEIIIVMSGRHDLPREHVDWEIDPSHNIVFNIPVYEGQKIFIHVYHKKGEIDVNQ